MVQEDAIHLSLEKRGGVDEAEGHSQAHIQGGVETEGSVSLGCRTEGKLKESLQEVQRAHPPRVAQLMQDLRQLRRSNRRVCLSSGVQCSVVMYKPQFSSLPHE